MKTINYKLQTCLPVGRVTNYTLIFICLFSLMTLHLLHMTSAVSAATWGGVDESVVEKYAEEHGRAASDPLINTDQGDLLLFVFLIAGAAGGFAAGYYWRQLTEKGQSTEQGTDRGEV